LKLPTLRFVGSKVIQPAPGTKTSAQAWVDPIPSPPHNVLIRIIEIARDDPRPKTETPSSFNEEDSEIPQEPQPRSRVWVGDCVPSSSRL